MRLRKRPARSAIAFLVATALFAPAWACGKRSGHEAGEAAREEAPPPGSASADSPRQAGGESIAPDEKVAGGRIAALSEARKLQLQTALLGMNKALLNFHILEGRYPANQAELESAPEVAGEVALLKAVVDSVSYRLDGGSYTLRVTIPDGPPITMTGSDPALRLEAP